MLPFFADQCVPFSIIENLRNAGYIAYLLKDFIHPNSPDPEVISEAQKRNAILVTLNGDFSDIISYPPGNYVGIIALQIRNHPSSISSIMNRQLDYFVANPEMTHYAGKLFLAEPHRIRVRK